MMMCAKALLPQGFEDQPLTTVTESLSPENPIPTLSEFGKVLGTALDSSVSILGQNHIRIPTPHTIDDEEIRSLREFIANSLYLPVNIFRERKYIEIVAI